MADGAKTSPSGNQGPKTRSSGAATGATGARAATAPATSGPPASAKLTTEGPAAAKAATTATSSQSRAPPSTNSNIPLHEDVLAAQRNDVLSVLIVLRLCSVFCVRTFFQPDEYFQALEPAWRLLHGPDSGAWQTWEWRYQLRTSLHPVLFAAVYGFFEGLMALMHTVGPLRSIVLAYLPGVTQAVISAAGDYSIWQLACQLYGQSDDVSWATLWLCLVSPWQWFCGARTFSNGLESALTSTALAYWPWQLLSGSSSDYTNLFTSPKQVRRLRLSLVLAAVAVVLRPTNLIIWGVVLFVVVTRMTLEGPAGTQPLSRPILGRLLLEILGCGLLVLGISALSDRLFYGEWTFPMYTFFDVNVRQDIAIFYGQSPWHYYFSQGLPLLTMAALPFALWGLYTALTTIATPGADPVLVLTANILKTLALAVVASVVTLSTVAHKEVRFLYPLLPLLNILAAPRVTAFFAPPPSSPKEEEKTSSARPDAESEPGLRRKPVLIAALVFHAIVAVFLSQLHQAAPVSAVTFLNTEFDRVHHDLLEKTAPIGHSDDVPLSFLAHPPQDREVSVGKGDELFALFLMPCHSTPWRSHLIYSALRARALTCEPPLDTPPHSAERAAYLDEADRFYAALQAGDDDDDDDADDSKRFAFLSKELWPLSDPEPVYRKQVQKDVAHSLPRDGEIPRYIVGFENIEPLLNDFFASTDPEHGGAGLGIHLHRAWQGWNGFFNDDWRRRGKVIVWDTGYYNNETHPDLLNNAWEYEDEPFRLI